MPNKLPTSTHLLPPVPTPSASVPADLPPSVPSGGARLLLPARPLHPVLPPPSLPTRL